MRFCDEIEFKNVADPSGCGKRLRSARAGIKSGVPGRSTFGPD